MRKIAFLLAALFLFSTPLPSFSEVAKSGKNECLLASKNCTDQVDDIYNRMHRLNKEIKKGKKVYTPAELKKLQDKLNETQDLLKSMEKPGR